MESLWNDESGGWRRVGVEVGLVERKEREDRKKRKGKKTSPVGIHFCSINENQVLLA